jgi:hypothetical protein
MKNVGRRMNDRVSHCFVGHTVFMDDVYLNEWTATYAAVATSVFTDKNERRLYLIMGTVTSMMSSHVIDLSISDLISTKVQGKGRVVGLIHFICREQPTDMMVASTMLPSPKISKNNAPVAPPPAPKLQKENKKILLMIPVEPPPSSRLALETNNAR